MSDLLRTGDSSDSQNGSAATMEEFLNQEEASSKRLAHGDIIDGVVVRVDPDEVLVDVGSKSEGVISSRELGPREAGVPDLHSGDHIKVFVLQPENEDGNVVLSLRRARAESVWLTAQDKQVSGEMIDAEVREQNKGGLIVNILGLANSTIRMAFLHARPTRTTKPICTKMLTSMPRRAMPVSALSKHIGTTKTTASGSDQLSYRPASTKKTSTAPSTNALNGFCRRSRNCSTLLAWLCK